MENVRRETIAIKEESTIKIYDAENFFIHIAMYDVCSEIFR